MFNIFKKEKTMPPLTGLSKLAINTAMHIQIDLHKLIDEEEQKGNDSIKIEDIKKLFAKATEEEIRTAIGL